MNALPDAAFPEHSRKLLQLLRQRIVILDGAMGTMIQRYKFDEAAFRGKRFANWSAVSKNLDGQPGNPIHLKGNNDLLVLTQPNAIRAIHESYLYAGADIIETNT